MVKRILVNIDFKVMEDAFRTYVRKKAERSNSTIVYIKDGTLVEEDPTTRIFTVLNSNPHTVQ